MQSSGLIGRHSISASNAALQTQSLQSLASLTTSDRTDATIADRRLMKLRHPAPADETDDKGQARIDCDWRRQ